MNKASEPLLDLLAESELALSPTAILVNLEREMDDPPGESTLYRAYGPLEEHGYIENVSERGTYYVITGKGRSYLKGEDIDG